MDMFLERLDEKENIRLYIYIYICINIDVYIYIYIYEKNIEDAVRRDTAAPHFGGSAFCESFWQLTCGDSCLAIVWLSLFDLA